MTITASLAGTAKGDVVENGDVVANNSGLADDDAGRVVEEKALTEAGSGVDVDREDIGDAGVESEGKRAARLGPKRVRNTVSLESEKALVIEEAVGEGDASGVTVAGGEKVSDGGGEERGEGGEGLEKEIIEKGGEEGGGAELVGEVEGERASKRGVSEDGGVQEAGEGGLGVGVAVSFGFDLGPYP